MGSMKGVAPPVDMEDFLAKGWDSQILHRIRNFNLHDQLNKPEDLCQDIFLALLETRYIERYSPEKGTFSTYLCGFVDNFLKKKYNKENTRNGKFIVNAVSLASTPTNDEDMDGTEVYLDLQVAGSKQENFEINIIIEEIREELAYHKANSYVEYQGQVLPRNALTVFDFLIKDYSIVEIAEILKTSRQYVYYLSKKIRELSQFDPNTLEY